MSKAAINPEALLALEHPFVKVPYEQLRRSIRLSQKLIEKELSQITSATSDIAEKCVNGNVPPEDAFKVLDGVAERVKKLKRKLEENKKEERTFSYRSRARLVHLNELADMKQYGSTEYTRWARTRLNRILVDYMLREGLMSTAKALTSELGLEPYSDIELFAQARRIEQALQRRTCSEALHWCSENKSTLRKSKSRLEFQLRMQEYVELVRKGQLMEAIAYAKKYLISWSDTYQKEIETALGLLAFKEDTTCKPYMKLFNKDRWQDLLKQFRTDNFSLNSLPNESLLTLTLQAGLSALKTSQCYEATNRNFNCPVCATDTLGVLAERLPLSHHLNSTIVCRIAGEMMNEDNPPMALPNGMVYSYKALMDIAAKNDGHITCPRTGASFDVFHLKKVYIS